MNRLALARRTQIVNCLVEGNSIRSTERLTDTHRDTVTRLLVQVGNGCAKLLDEQMRDLNCRRVQVDEVWTYCQKKQRWVTPQDDARRVGDQWIFVAIDAESKIVPTYRVGKRRRADPAAFMQDLSNRLSNRVQISSDALSSYVDAVERAFGREVDYGQTVKFYEAEPIWPGRYSPPRVVREERTVIAGNPDQDHISTSIIERQNLTMHMSMRRLTRLTNAFSKKVENLQAAVGLHFAHYNFARVHKSLRVTPAMAAGITDRLWSLEEIVERTSN
jgi:IS1 family transposase